MRVGGQSLRGRVGRGSRTLEHRLLNGGGVSGAAGLAVTIVAGQLLLDN